MTLTEYRCFLHRDNHIGLEHCRGLNALDISFRRTIRVPDNDHTNCLPPDLGKFPLFKVKDFASALPKDMSAKGGLFFPMYQREAMWIDFRAKTPFMIKIYAGGINIVSGERADEDMATKLRRSTLRADKKSLQDYLVVPEQRWVDGIATSPGLVKQFVAMPMGKGYPVEAQITGRETTGGLQFEITPVRDVKLPPVGRRRVEGMPPPGNTLIFVKTMTGETIQLQIDLDESVDVLSQRIQDTEGIPVTYQRLMYAGERMQFFRTLSDYNIQPKSTVFLFIELRGGGTDPDERKVEMALAPGGLIQQTIATDFHAHDRWHEKLTITFNVQILNSQTFYEVTGEAPPESPVSAKTYAECGLPFFAIFGEPSIVHGAFQGVKSVGTMDEERDDEHEYPLVYFAKDGTRLKASQDTHKTQYTITDLIDDPDNIINTKGPMRKFRTVHDLESQADSLSVATFDSDMN